MSCTHGNIIGFCDICTEIEQAFERGAESVEKELKYANEKYIVVHTSLSDEIKELRAALSAAARRY